MRHDGRAPNQLRPVAIETGFISSASGSALVSAGKTRVICTASIEKSVPPWRESSGHGWVTAEYDMLPGATGQRRGRNRGKIDGRTQEIQRLVGRALRAAVDMSKMGSNSILIDCDVIEADGGTRTASITGAYVALCAAIANGKQQGLWGDDVVICQVAAISVGIVDGELLLDLNYVEDVRADVDCNLVLTSRNEWIEVQATGERTGMSDDHLTGMI
ncbi:MAG: ribonuclease PH, partial [Phycisphaerae bacterium]